MQNSHTLITMTSGQKFITKQYISDVWEEIDRYTYGDNPSHCLMLLLDGPEQKPVKHVMIQHIESIEEVPDSFQL